MKNWIWKCWIKQSKMITREVLRAFIIQIKLESPKTGCSVWCFETYFTMESLFCASEINVQWFGICQNKEISRYLILFLISFSGRIKGLCSHDALTFQLGRKLLHDSCISLTRQCSSLNFYFYQLLYIYFNDL